MKLLSLTQAAEFLNVSRSFLSNNIGKDGYPPYYKIGKGKGKIMYSEEDLVKYLEERKVG